MLILFCRDPLRPTRPDDMYLAEADAGTRHGFSHQLPESYSVIEGDGRGNGGQRGRETSKSNRIAVQKTTESFSRICSSRNVTDAGTESVIRKGLVTHHHG